MNEEPELPPKPKFPPDPGGPGRAVPEIPPVTAI